MSPGDEQLRRATGRRGGWPVALGAALLAGFASLALPATLGYDAWAWTVWGRQLAHLGQTALPAGLLSVGAAMRIERGQGPPGAHLWWLAVKLAAVPAIAWALALALGVSGMEGRVLMLSAALPTATNAYILAVRMTGDGRAVATQVTLGTVLSMATIPAWMAVPL